MLGSSSLAYAATDSEDANLAKIVQILDSLTPLINAAERNQNPSAREQFHYDWLRSDIDNIKIGINQKLANSQTQPRMITPLHGDYLTLTQKPL